jgi:hypothetical protein
LLFQFNTNAQIEEHYHHFSGNIYVPIIVDHYKAIEYDDGRLNEDRIPDKEFTLSVHMRFETRQVKNGTFKAVVLKEVGTAHDEFIRLKGKVSKDKEKLVYVEITKEAISYRTDSREDIEKTESVVVRMENIPKSPYGGGYKFKYGTSEIASVRYSMDQMIKRHGYMDKSSMKYVNIDNEKLNKYYSGFQGNFKPGALKLELKNDPKVTVVIDPNHNLGEHEQLFKGLGALLISELLKIEDLRVVEGLKSEGPLSEIKLSESGLVSESTRIKAGRILNPDVEIILLAEERRPADLSLPMEQFTLRSKVRNTKTGQILDLNLTFVFELKDGKGITGIEEYWDAVVDYTLYLLYK